MPQLWFMEVYHTKFPTLTGALAWVEIIRVNKDYRMRLRQNIQKLRQPVFPQITDIQKEWRQSVGKRPILHSYASFVRVWNNRNDPGCSHPSCRHGMESDPCPACSFQDKYTWSKLHYCTLSDWQQPYHGLVAP